jgi:hypothetical protein
MIVGMIVVAVDNKVADKKEDFIVVIVIVVIGRR